MPVMPSVVGDVRQGGGEGLAHAWGAGDGGGGRGGSVGLDDEYARQGVEGKVWWWWGRRSPPGQWGTVRRVV